MVKTLIWVAVGILALSFFGISIRALFESPTNQDNLSFILGLAHTGWQIIVDWLKHIPGLFMNLFNGIKTDP